MFLFSQKLHKWNGQWSLTNDPKMYHEQRLYIIFKVPQEAFTQSVIIEILVKRYDSIEIGTIKLQ